MAMHEKYLDDFSLDISLIAEPVNISFFDTQNQIAKMLTPPIILSMSKSIDDY